MEDNKNTLNLEFGKYQWNDYENPNDAPDFKWIYENDRKYCNWIMKQTWSKISGGYPDSIDGIKSNNLKEFQQYIRLQKHHKKPRHPCQQNGCKRGTSNDSGLCSAHRPDVKEYRRNFTRQLYQNRNPQAKQSKQELYNQLQALQQHNIPISV